MPKPKPKRGSADDHREDGDEEGDSGDVETVEMPEDVEEVETQEESDDQPAGTVLPDLPYREIAIAGAAAITIYMAWKYYNNQQTSARRQMTEAEAKARAEQQQAQQGGAGNREPAGPSIPQDPNNPLAADEAAGDQIFSGWGS